MMMKKPRMSAASFTLALAAASGILASVAGARVTMLETGRREPKMPGNSLKSGV